MKKINDAHPVLETNVIDDLIELRSSTTVYLEALRNSRMNVQMLAQHQDGRLITRVTKLYFSSAAHPLVYSESTIFKDLLSKEEYQFIDAQELPLGRIFIQLNGLASISKKNIAITRDTFAYELQVMNLRQDRLYKKTYDFMIGMRKVATIAEFFNSESIQRL